MFDQAGAGGAGTWAEHRNAIHFTGDTFATWPMLDFQTRFTAAEGAGIGLPVRLARHRQLQRQAAAQRPLRALGPVGRRASRSCGCTPTTRPACRGSTTAGAGQIAALFLRLRESLVPYLYTLARQAYDTGLPLARAMYLEWPKRREAYRFDRQYMLGGELLAAPVGEAGRSGAQAGLVPAGRAGSTCSRARCTTARGSRR